jgi:hypothetical protein
MKTSVNKINHWPELKIEVDKILIHDPLVKEGKMFGYPAYYVNGKLAACHYNAGVALKLPAEVIHALGKHIIASEAFCPMGRKMGKNWVIIFPKRPKEIHDVSDILTRSVDFVRQLK